MPEVPNVVIDFRERQSARNYADGIDRVPNTFWGKSMSHVPRTSNLPNTDKFNINVDGKGFFEGCTLTPSNVIVSGVHFVCKGDLLMIASRQQTNFVDPT